MASNKIWLVLCLIIYSKTSTPLVTSATPQRSTPKAENKKQTGLKKWVKIAIGGASVTLPAALAVLYLKPSLKQKSAASRSNPPPQQNKPTKTIETPSDEEKKESETAEELLDEGKKESETAEELLDDDNKCISGAIGGTQDAPIRQAMKEIIAEARNFKVEGQLLTGYENRAESYPSFPAQCACRECEEQFNPNVYLNQLVTRIANKLQTVAPDATAEEITSPTDSRQASWRCGYCKTKMTYYRSNNCRSKVMCTNKFCLSWRCTICNKMHPFTKFRCEKITCQLSDEYVYPCDLCYKPTWKNQRHICSSLSWRCTICNRWYPLSGKRKCDIIDCCKQQKYDELCCFCYKSIKNAAEHECSGAPLPTLKTGEWQCYICGHVQPNGTTDCYGRNPQNNELYLHKTQIRTARDASTIDPNAEATAYGSALFTVDERNIARCLGDGLCGWRGALGYFRRVEKDLFNAFKRVRETITNPRDTMPDPKGDLEDWFRAQEDASKLSNILQRRIIVLARIYIEGKPFYQVRTITKETHPGFPLIILLTTNSGGHYDRLIIDNAYERFLVPLYDGITSEIIVK